MGYYAKGTRVIHDLFDIESRSGGKPVFSLLADVN